jgi:hypothetical protein
LDISQSSEFIQSMYQTILRIRRETGKSVDIGNEAIANEIITQLKGQLAVFNLIENKTVMSLRNIADAFPEVTAAATSFGLSMTEATALILPMVFLTMSAVADVLYKTSDYWSKESERSLRWDDPDLAIAWPLAELGGLEPLLSEKDAVAPLLAAA